MYGLPQGVFVFINFPQLCSHLIIVGPAFCVEKTQTNMVKALLKKRIAAIGCKVDVCWIIDFKMYCSRKSPRSTARLHFLLLRVR